MCGGHCLGSRVGRGFPGWVMDNVQCPTGAPLLMPTLQKEASGTGSQNVPACPGRPGLKDKGRQRKCQYKMQTWHKYFLIQPREIVDSSSFLSLLWRNLSVSLSKSQEGTWSSSEVQMGSQALISGFWSFQQQEEAVQDVSQSELLITWPYQHHGPWNVFCVEMHSYGYQQKDRRIWQVTILDMATVGHKVKATARNLHSSLKFMLDQANKEVAAVLQLQYFQLKKTSLAMHP